MEKLIDKYRPADYEDCFSRTLIGGERMKPRDLLELVFVRYPEPVSWLMKREFGIRKLLKKLWE